MARFSVRRIKMLIGLPKEIKNNEFRVGLVPSSVAELVTAGHQVMVQSGQGPVLGQAMSSGGRGD